MAKRKKTKARAKPRGGRRSSSASTASRSEWVGGRLLAPFFITEDEPFRPELILWLELPAGMIVSHTLVVPDEPPVSFAQTLREAMRAPMVGPPRQPSRIRVADALLASELRGAVPGVEVEVAPTPELDEVLRSFAEFRASHDVPGEAPPSYLEGGRISAEAIDKLFEAAEALYHVAPWTFASDDEVIRLDIPQLGVEGACISIIGELGESLGVVIFPSLVAYERFVDRAEAHQLQDGPLDLGTTMLALDYERGAELPASLRKEIASYGWPVAAPDAYPSVCHRDPDGLPRPLEERDVAIASACAVALAAFCGRHRELFGDDAAELEPISESYHIGDAELEVRFTMPYEVGPDFGLSTITAAISASLSQPSEPSEPPSRAAPASIHDVDRRLVDEMMSFADRRFGEAWWKATADFDDHEGSATLWGPWSVYHFLVEGRPVVEWYLEQNERKLSSTELSWLRAQQAAWLSVWEVVDVEAGQSITLEDLLTGEKREVHEVAASRSVGCRDALLCRVIDHDGVSVLGAVYPRSLPPVAAAEVVRRIRSRLRRKRAVPIDRLRDEKIGRYMIARWDEAVLELEMERAVLPRLQNTDGEELLMTIDHFDVDPARQALIEEQLAQLEDVEPPDEDDDDRSYVFSKSGNAQVGGLQDTLIGRATVAHGKLRVETNSLQRADALRLRIEAACGDAISHRAREHSDPQAMLAGLLAGGGAADPRLGASAFDAGDHDDDDEDDEDDDISAEEVARLILEMKATHYATWPDQPMPALAGKTPREAVRSKAGREQVDLLLKDCENREAREPMTRRFDFSGLRAELGLRS